MKKFEVIIPVINVDLLIELFKSISLNTLLPHRIIIINNSGRFTDDLCHVITPFIDNNIAVYIYYSQTGLVNESLNIGITKLSNSCDYVSFLNDDIILSNCFFQRNLEVFQNEICGIACPRTVHSMDELDRGKVRTEQMSRREGWAFSIKKNLLDKIPPFPANRIATFHFDDWIWYHAKHRGFYWYKDLGNVIYHKIGSSVLKLGFRNHKKKEWNEFQKIATENSWGKE